uniref:Tripartite motif-containing protein 16-like n=1 Tax=Erpetoichthys calabaricus TaxID=27687 RepID=A0A8C4TDT8_ERPCA
MAEAQLCGLQDEFTCSVCLDTLTDPVTIPCGHSFCLKCLTDCWGQSQLCSCPQCRHNFTRRPALRRTTLHNEVIKKLKKTTISPPPPPSKNYAGPGDVECDFCTGKKFRAAKSCLTCPASYCRTHLQPHYEVAALKHHKLVDPDRNLKEKLCEKHQKSLEIFCKTDKTCICIMCVVTGHKNHEMVELEMEREEKQVSGKSFTALIRCIEEADRKLTERIREQEKTETEKAEGVMEQLKKEIEELKRREDELKELSETKDHLHFLQVSSTLLIRLGYFCPLTLDINTAHRDLRLSEGNKKVTCDGTKAKYPDHPDRFDCWPQVLCRVALTGTRCYWEVEGSGDFMEIGVAYKGLSRKGGGDECGLGNNNKSWSLWCSDSQYSVRHNNKRTVISAPYSPRIGVYLDWPAGSLSFYSVSHTMTLLHTFNTSFTEPLYPGFYLDPHCSWTPAILHTWERGEKRIQCSVEEIRIK